MSKVLVFTLAQPGHINPSLPLTEALVKQGEEVIYYTDSQYQAAIEATGATFRPTDAPSILANLTGRRGMSDMADFGGIVDKLAPEVQAEHADYVIYDSMCLWGRLLVEQLNIPAIRFNATHAFSNASFTPITIALGMSPVVKFVLPLLKRSVHGIQVKHKLPTVPVNDLYTRPERLDLVFLPKRFQIAADSFGDSFKFVGPLIERKETGLGDFPFSELAASGKPVLYISLGTIANKRLDFYKECFTAFRDRTDWQVVMSVGKNIDMSELGEIPANFIVRASVPQLKLLEKISVFITHGGMNSTMEALSFGVPLILLPQMGEQQKNAQQVVDLGAGITLANSTKSKAPELVQALNIVSQTASYRQNAVIMQQAIRESGGIQQAMQGITEFKAKYLPVNAVMA